MDYDTRLRVGQHIIGLNHPTYFIADIAANHDGDLERAKDLIWKAKEAGADAAKFQHFLAKKIVSDHGFRNLGGQLSHQSNWKKSVFEVYEDYELNRDWTPALAETAREAKIDFMTTPYDLEAIESVAPLVPAFKIGSGDITWIEAVEAIAAQDKPVFLATGASSMEDVERAVEAVLKHNRTLCLMQCNTNYTGDLENLAHVNLRVLQSYALRFPGLPLGLSDHTPGHASVLGAIALGARAVEKHFTDDPSREGPDHGFSMTPETWSEMVARSRELEAALGDGTKRVEANERQTVVVQRRALYLTRDMAKGCLVSADCVEALRPAPEGTIEPYKLPELIGCRLLTSKKAGEALSPDDVEWRQPLKAAS